MDDTDIAGELKRDPDGTVRRLVAAYRTRLYQTAYRICGNAADAEDLTFRTFAQAVRKISDYGGKGGFFGWLYAILSNFYRMDRRLKAANALDFMPEVPDSPDPAPTAVETVSKMEDASVLHGAIAALPDAFREVVVFRYFEDMTLEEIARTMGISKGTVKSRLNRAKRMIRRKIGGTLFEERASIIRGGKL